MKQLAQNYKTGELALLDVPVPARPERGLVVGNRASVVSIGTEKLMMDMARKSLLGKARARPDLVRQTLDKLRTDGVRETYRAVMSRLDNLTPLGYSCAGVTTDADRFSDVRVGDSVACFGSGHASHADYVAIPGNLYTRVPGNMPMEHAAFAGIGAIALHAVRLGRTEPGMDVAVIGLGLLGQIAVQLLASFGCRVFAVDVDSKRVELAHSLGADDAVSAIEPNLSERASSVNGGRGADVVFVFASAASSDPVTLAAELAASGGRLVVPGMVDLNLPRRDFYEKELEFVVSRSAGPGIYDPGYELKGIDYPQSLVRWTAQRNMQHFLDLLASGTVQVAPLITHSYPIAEAENAYEMITNAEGGALGVVLTYPEDAPAGRSIQLRERQPARPGHDVVRVGVVGAGLWARTTLLPILSRLKGIELVGLATATGPSARHSGDKFGFDYVTTDRSELIADTGIDAIVVATRHDLHMPVAKEALLAQKDVFVEKPLALNHGELEELAAAVNSGSARLVVGFNRRFSSFAVRARELLGNQGPWMIMCRVNAGPVDGESWVHDPEIGGGRIIGEVCHFVDLVQYLSDSRAVRVYAEGFQDGVPTVDNVIVTLKLADGSAGTIIYGAQGDKRSSRERIEIMGGGAMCTIDDFRELHFSRAGKRSTLRKRGGDLGHRAEFEAFFNAIREGSGTSFPLDEVFSASSATLAIPESLTSAIPVEVRSVDGLEQPA